MDAHIKKVYVPMTETSFYILLCLRTPNHGYGIVQKVKELTDNEVVLGPGTMYGSLSKLEIENKGAFNTIAQKLFGKPRYTKIHLDDNGTFIWPLIDGRKTVEDIAALVKDEFGEKAEPLYPRIVKYFQIMESYHFVNFINKPEK